jgi:hypothetical protein
MSITKLTTNGLAGAKYDTVSADNYYMEPIATTLLGSSQATISFTNIPQNYKHLQVRGIMRNDVAITGMGDLRVRFNSDSSANYVYHILYGDGTSAAAGAATSQTYGRLARNVTPCANNGTSIFGTFIADILDYSNVNKFKTIRSLGGSNNNTATAAAQSISLTSSAWLNTAPISQIDITDDSSGNFVQYSRFSLYGIKG